MKYVGVDSYLCIVYAKCEGCSHWSGDMTEHWLDTVESGRFEYNSTIVLLVYVHVL